jgi:hypothetical protein
MTSDQLLSRIESALKDEGFEDYNTTTGIATNDTVHLIQQRGLRKDNVEVTLSEIRVGEGRAVDVKINVLQLGAGGGVAHRELIAPSHVLVEGDTTDETAVEDAISGLLQAISRKTPVDIESAQEEISEW